MTPAFSSFSAFLAMGGYAFYVWLSVSVAVVALGSLIGHSLWQHRALLHAVRRQQRREQRLQASGERRHKEHTHAGTS